MWMNEHEVEDAQRFFDPDEVPNLAQGAHVLSALVDWTNSHSDGWPYWKKPSAAAERLMDLLHEHTYAAQFGYYQGTARPLEDASETQMRDALRPIKSFLTRQGVNWDADLPWAAILPVHGRSVAEI